MLSSSPLFGIARSLTTTQRNKSLFWTAQRFRSANANENAKAPSRRDDESDQPKQGFYSVYVHHVSKLALEHLQQKRSDWLIEKGLDHGLHINSNGTFSLRFPARKGFDAGRIWTSYDVSRKQHWLSVYRQKLAVRFLLKDHGRTMATQKFHDSSRKEQHIFDVVDQMILAVDQIKKAKRK